MASTNTISGTIDGVAIAGYARRLHRGQFLCNPSQNATLVLANSFPGSLDPGMSVVLNENGTKVLTGYTIQISRERPSHDITVEIVDTYTRVMNTFLTEKLTTTEGFNTDYWAGQILSQTGISYSVDSPSYSVPPGVELGLRMAHEALFDICTYASWYLYVDAGGVLHLTDLTSPATSESITNWIEFGRGLGTEQTRNVIKVYGQVGLGPLGRDRIFTKATRSISGVDPDMVAAVASPLIATQAEAQRVADYMLTELGTLTDIKTGVAIGSPSRRVGQRISLTHSGNNFSFSGTDVLTTLESEISEGGGYQQDMKLGEKCPRIAGWSRVVPPVYAGTTGSGVFRSTDGGITWTAFNTGLPTSTKYVRRLANNALDETMTIVNGRLYYNPGGDNGTWTQKTLPAPVNDAGDTPALGYGVIKVVDASGAAGGFFVMTVNASSGSSGDPMRARTWVYETQNASATTPTWTSAQLSSSGSGYHVAGIDMSSRFGTAYVIATSGSEYAIVDGDCVMEASIGDLTPYVKYLEPVPGRCCQQGESTVNFVCEPGSSDVGIIDWWPQFADNQGCAPNRSVRFTIRVKFIHKLLSTGVSHADIYVNGVINAENRGPFAITDIGARAYDRFSYSAGSGYIVDERDLILAADLSGTYFSEVNVGSAFNIKLMMMYERVESSEPPLRSSVVVGKGYGFECASKNDVPSDPTFCNQQEQDPYNGCVLSSFIYVGYYTAGTIFYSFCDEVGC